MQQMTFTTTIKAPRELVWNTMLDPASYREWTRPFMEGSYYEGSWDEGATIRFLSPSGEGMAATIERNQLHEFISIRHLGFVANGKDDTTSEAVTSWARPTRTTASRPWVAARSSPSRRTCWRTTCP